MNKARKPLSNPTKPYSMTIAVLKSSSHETVANFTHDEYRLLKNAPDWAKDAIAQVLNAPRTGLNDDIHENPFKTPSDSEKEIGPEPNIPC